MSESDVHVVELLPAYALDILPPEEARFVEEHLDACDSCRTELQAYEAVTAELALTAPVAAPPDRLEARLMAAIAPGPAVAPRRARPSLGDRLQAAWRRLAVQPAWTVAGLALLVLLFLVVTQLSSPSPAAFPTFTMTGTAAAPAASGLVVSSADGLHGTVVVQLLPVVDEEEEQYQLWLLEDGGWEDGGLISVDEDGYGARYVLADNLLTSYDAFAVTLEPAGGSPRPTGPEILHSP